MEVVYGVCSQCNGEVSFPDESEGLESLCPWCGDVFEMTESPLPGGPIEGSASSQGSMRVSAKKKSKAPKVALISVASVAVVAAGVFGFLKFKGGSGDSGEGSASNNGSATQMASASSSGGNSSAPSSSSSGGSGMDNGMGMGMDNSMGMDNGMMAMEGSMSMGMDASAAEGLTFDKDILPIFKKACIKCHGAEKQKGGLRIDSKSHILKGADGMPVAINGKPENSSLYGRIILPGSSDEVMPPNGNVLSKTDTEKVRKWIAGGMP